VNYIPADYRTPYVQSWHFTIQRELAHNVLLDVGYVGTHGTKLMVLGDYNEARPSRAGENLTVDQRRPIPGFSYIEIAYNGNSSVYDALQVKLEKRYSKGIYLLNSFTWSKGIDYASGHLEANNGDNSRVNLLDVKDERGLSGYDRRLNNTTTITYELPKGHGWGSYFYGGWHSSVINSMFSGQPLPSVPDASVIGPTVVISLEVWVWLVWKQVPSFQHPENGGLPVKKTLTLSVFVQPRNPWTDAVGMSCGTMATFEAGPEQAASWNSVML